MLRLRGVEGENSGGLAVRGRDLRDARNRGLHIRVRVLAEMPEAGRQIGRADEQRVDLGQCGDRLRRRQRRRALDLHDGAGGRVGREQCARYEPEAIATRDAGHPAHAAVALVRKAHRARRRARLVGAVHGGEKHGLRAGVHRALDQRRRVFGHAHHRMRGCRADRLQQADQIHRVGGRMFGVDHQEVEAGVRQGLACQR
ncbi:MAG: hypothetical protein U5L03_02785 [Burkholderiaceae bacterium]|nr:hypothetical protein [Burkholderiaceae bacterium]